jgi:hypothetical protein
MTGTNPRSSEFRTYALTGTSAQIAPAARGRYRLQVTGADTAEPIYVWCGAAASPTQALVIPISGPPLILCRDDLGSIIEADWFACTAAGKTAQIGVIDTVTCPCQGG